MNPRVEVSITRTIEAEHSLPSIGAAQRHKHSYSIECGYLQEIDFKVGCARPMQDADREVVEVVSRLEGQYLNDILPGPPTAEVMACWILSQLPSHFEWVVIRAYFGFMCRINRKELLSSMANLPVIRP